VIAVPPVATVYHRYCPLVPPDALRIIVDGEQPDAPVVMGAVGTGLMVAITEVRVLSQLPLLMETKYEVVAESDGVTYILFTSPVIAVPPVATVYQRYCPFVPPEALSVREATPHDDAPVIEGEAGSVVMVAVTATRALSQDPIKMET